MKIEQAQTQRGVTVSFDVDECDAFIRLAQDVRLAGVTYGGGKPDYLNISVRLGIELGALIADDRELVPACEVAAVHERHGDTDGR